MVVDGLWSLCFSKKNNVLPLVFFFVTVENVLDDVANARHSSFMSQYLRDWPYPHLTHYIAGQSLNAELNGVMQRCEVQVVDSSLIQVVFQVSITSHCCY